MPPEGPFRQKVAADYWFANPCHRAPRLVGYPDAIYKVIVIMEQATVFQINRSQAVRLPKSIAFPNDVKRVDVVVLGRVRILVPAGESWESWFNGEGVSADFMESREQPDDQHREGL